MKLMGRLVSITAQEQLDQLMVCCLLKEILQEITELKPMLLAFPVFDEARPQPPTAKLALRSETGPAPLGLVTYSNGR